jgi:hypothetical protein
MVLTLVLIFLSATAAVGGASAGIWLVVVGGAKGKPALLVWGLVLGVVSFGAMIGAIAWAIKVDPTRG